MKLSGLQRNLPLSSLATLLAVTVLSASAQEHRLLHDTSELHVTVRNTTGTPVRDARVVMHVIKHGNDQGAMEVRTNDEGQVEQDIIPLGNVVRLQVSAPGFKTYGTDYPVNALVKDIVIRLKEQPVLQTAMVELPPDISVHATPSVPSTYKEAQWIKGAHTSLVGRNTVKKTSPLSVRLK